MRRTICLNEIYQDTSDIFHPGIGGNRNITGTVTAVNNLKISAKYLIRQLEFSWSENYMYNEYNQGMNEEMLREEELAEAETMIRNGADTRQIMRKQFSTIGQSDLYKIYRKYGISYGGEQSDS